MRLTYLVRVLPWSFPLVFPTTLEWGGDCFGLDCSLIEEADTRGPAASGARGQPQAEMLGLDELLENSGERSFRQLPPQCKLDQWLKNPRVGMVLVVAEEV